MTHSAAEKGIHVEGAADQHWEPEPDTCSHVDPEHGGCVLRPSHDGDHEYAEDPLEG